MKTSLIATLAALAIASVSHASVGSTITAPTDEFNKDAQAFGNAVESIDTATSNEMINGTVQIVVGPAGESIKLVGDVTADAGMAVAGVYEHTLGGLKCLAKNPLNPFHDGGCVVQFAGRTIVFAIHTAANGATTIIVGSANILAQPFEGFKHVMNSAADATGRMDTPVGAFFVLAYELADGGEKIIHFALVDVAGKTVTVLASNGAKIVKAPTKVLYNIVTLRWGKAGLEIVALPFELLNDVVNVPTEILFNKKNMVMRAVSPAGRWVEHKLGIHTRH